MLFSHFRRSILAPFLMLGLAVGSSLRAESATDIQVSQHQTKAGHAFHYLEIEKAKEVAIILSWPSNWIDGDGAIATPYVGSKLMLSSGAGERDAATLAADFQDLNAFGDVDETSEAVIGTLVVRPENLAAAAALGRDVLVENHLDERWQKRVQQNLKATQLSRHKKLSTESWDTIRRAILGDSRLNDSLTVRPASLIDDVTADDIRTWHAETFTTTDITIVAAGPIEPVSVGDAIDQLLDGLPASPKQDETSAAEDNPPPTPLGKTILLHKPDAQKTLIRVAGLLPPAKERDYAYDLFAEIVLGKTKQSRLFDAVRTKLRASYVVDAGVDNYDRKTRLIFLDAELEGRQIGDVQAAFRDAYEGLRTSGITGDEFARVKDLLVAHFQEIEKEPESMAGLLMGFLLTDDPASERIAEIPEMIEALTLDEINAAIRRRLPAFDDMIRVITASDDQALNTDCVIASVPDVDRCRF